MGRYCPATSTPRHVALAGTRCSCSSKNALRPSRESVPPNPRPADAARFSHRGIGLAKSLRPPHAERGSSSSANSS
eukprot:scaffold29905_cov64-Phaeocystis_antarctica.AAC.8